jgi:hypothetical protein
MFTRLLSTIGLTLILATAQVGVALAAPIADESTPITGTVQNIVIETDATTGETTVLVTLLDAMGATQTVRISLADAQTLGLVTIDPITGLPVVNLAAICPPGGVCTPISIDPALIIADEAMHPVALALSKFFGVDYDLIMMYHGQGYGFGVIAQSLWLSNQLGGSPDMFELILVAKKSHDFSAITLPDGTHPKNWGQFRKALLENKQNLGAIMSGKADPLAKPTLQTTTTNGNGHGHGKGHGHQGKGKNK